MSLVGRLVLSSCLLIVLWRYLLVTARIPALPTGKVTTVLIRPGHAILAAGAVGILH
jgi:hypothetical protein